MATKAKKTTATKKASGAKKPAAKKSTAAKKKKTVAATPKKVSEKTSAKNVELENLDRKSLAARARQLKKELLAIRFNMQSPSLRDYRNKRKELASVLSRLGSN
jgi:ribosomal protein L29